MFKYEDICSSDNTLPLRTTTVVCNIDTTPFSCPRGHIILCLLLWLCYDYIVRTKNYIYIVDMNYQYVLNKCFHVKTYLWGGGINK